MEPKKLSRREQLEQWRLNKKRNALKPLNHHQSTAKRMTTTNKAKPQPRPSQKTQQQPPVASASTPHKLSSPPQFLTSTKKPRQVSRVEQLKDKLVLSTKKRKTFKEHAVQSAKQEHVRMRKLQLSTVKRRPDAQKRADQVKQRNLRLLVTSQVDVAVEMLKNKDVNGARSFLSILKDEVPLALQTSMYWVAMSQVAEAADGVANAAKVLEEARLMVSDAQDLEVLDEHKNELLERLDNEDRAHDSGEPDTSNLATQNGGDSPEPNNQDTHQDATSPNVDHEDIQQTKKVLQFDETEPCSPESEDQGPAGNFNDDDDDVASNYDEDEDLGEIMVRKTVQTVERTGRRRLPKPSRVPTPFHTKKSPRNPTSDDMDLDDVAVSPPAKQMTCSSSRKNSLMASGARRVAFPDSDNDMLFSAVKHPRKIAHGKVDFLAAEEEGRIESGTFITMDVVRSSKKEVEDLGATKVATPVRRSARHSTKKASKLRVDALREADFVYKPNPAIAIASPSATLSHTQRKITFDFGAIVAEKERR